MKLLNIMGVILAVGTFPILFAGKILYFIGDTICWCVCMGMAKLNDAANKPEVALTWLNIYTQSEKEKK